MRLEGQVGVQNNLDSAALVAARMGRQGDQIVSELHGRYYEQALRGNLFISDSDAVTLAAANATKGAAGTIKLINGFVNPYGSGKNAVILLAKSGSVSGTPAGPLFYNMQQLPAGVSLTNAPTGTIRNALLGGPASAMTSETGVVLTRSDAATTAFSQLALHGGPAAIAAGAGSYSVIDEVAGSIIVPPGFVFGLACVGAGTSHVVQSTLVWEEVPI